MAGATVSSATGPVGLGINEGVNKLKLTMTKLYNYKTKFYTTGIYEQSRPRPIHDQNGLIYLSYKSLREVRISPILSQNEKCTNFI